MIGAAAFAGDGVVAVSGSVGVVSQWFGAAAPSRFAAGRTFSVSPAVAVLARDGTIVATASEVTVSIGALVVNGLYAFPLPVEAVSLGQIVSNHHTYPASDMNVPEGTPIYAAHAGVVERISIPSEDPDKDRCGLGVTIAGQDGHVYTYCHGSALAAHIYPGVVVGTGETIMLSGNTGRSSAPHLHFQIRDPGGRLICPQGPLEAWWLGIALSPVGAPDSGCSY
ncbi:MAG: M23 family metallopeptidase [Acidimicrobiia bacterium]